MPGQRKSIEPMAARLGAEPQRLQQFMADSPWDETELWRVIRRKSLPDSKKILNTVILAVEQDAFTATCSATLSLVTQMFLLGHYRRRTNAIRFLMKTLQARPVSRLVHAFRKKPLWYARLRRCLRLLRS